MGLYGSIWGIWGYMGLFGVLWGLHGYIGLHIYIYTGVMGKNTECRPASMQP